MAQHGELGLYGTATPGEVTEARRAEGPSHVPEEGAHDSILAEKVKQAETREPPGRDDREIERE